MGNLVRDPELREIAGGKKVLNFSIAVNRRFKRENGSAKETAFLDCEAWDTGAEMIAKYFKKGSPIIIHASVKQETWDDKESGQKRSKLRFRVNQFEFVPRIGGGGNAEGGADAAEEPAVSGDGGDIPF